MTLDSKVDTAAAVAAKPTGFKRLYRALLYSRQGLMYAFRSEAAFRQEVAAALLLIPLALVLGDSGMERALLVTPVFAVLIVELLNSAIEATVDRVGLERHTLAGVAKDMGSAAVALALGFWAVVWSLVLIG